MKVEVAMLGKLYTIELEEGVTGEDLRKKFNVPATYYLKGLPMKLDVPLKDGDKIEIIFAFGGG